MPEEDVEIKLVLTEPSYNILNGEYNCGVIAKKNILVSKGIEMKFENGTAYIYTRQIQGKIVKKTEKRSFAFDGLMYCTEYSEELIARFTEIEEYFMIEGCENTEESVYNYYFFEFEEYWYAIHTVDITSEEGSWQEIAIYRMVKI